MNIKESKQQEKKKKIYFLFFILVLLLFMSVIIAVSIGTVNINYSHTFNIILKQFGFPIVKNWTEVEESIILEIRLPRVLACVVVGAMLSVAGVAAQGLFKNPIVDPYIIGISAAANFGVALSYVSGLSLILSQIAPYLNIFTIPMISFTFAIFSMLIIYNLSKTRYQLSISALLLSGIAISFFFSALTSFILFYFETSTHSILSYIMGSFSGIYWQEMYIMFIIMIFGVCLLYFYGNDLNLMVFGDTAAQSMGVNVERSKKIILILTILLTSTAVAFCGSIGFVGLMIPHLMRLAVGSDNRKLIIFSALGGSLLLLWADLLARTLIIPLEIPVGIITSLLGGPFFIYLIIKKKKSGELI